jgi:hypothetical protein
MPDASPYPDAKEHAFEREVPGNSSGTLTMLSKVNPNGRNQKSLSTRLPTLGRCLGRKKGFTARSPCRKKRASRSKVNAQVGEAQFTGIY